MWRNNGLSITLLGLFLVFQLSLSVVGLRQYNQEQADHGQPTVGYLEYISGPAILEATTENWESESLQFAYVLLTAFLYQKGSAESKDPDEAAAVDRDPGASKNKPDAPWPVRRGGVALALYKNSLALAFFVLFALSFVLHAVGGARAYSQDQLEHGGESVTTLGYLGTSQFWFESLQNPQSEFLAIGLMVLLSVTLCQQGLPESKPVDSPHRATGEG